MATPAADHLSSSNAGHSSPSRKHKHGLGSLRAKVDRVTTGISRLGVSITTTLNPNHRHDEEWEKEVDAKMEQIRDSHRFRSFADEREGNVVKFHVDGHDYFWALSEVIDEAKEVSDETDILASDTPERCDGGWC